MKTPALLLALAATLHADPPEPKFRAVTIDDKIQIGYGVTVADVDGDERPDILLADKKQFVWYRNPGADKSGDPAQWSKFILAENLTKNDNVCLAAEDLDGDGKCEIAVGAEWNPGDTVNSGAVFYLIPPADRTRKWEPVKLSGVEPTTHRMRWLRLRPAYWSLVVVPLHGRGNKNGEGAPVKVLAYRVPEELPVAPVGPESLQMWESELADASMHMTHNFYAPQVEEAAATHGDLILGGKEGLTMISARRAGWKSKLILKVGEGANSPVGIGEVRMGQFGTLGEILTTVEPMHGNSLVVYLEEKSAAPKRRVLTDKLTEGHALACGDLLRSEGRDQIVVGWRGTPGKEGSTTGVAMWTPLDDKGEQWRETMIDHDGMACEDLVLSDLNGDGKLDIIASGRATHNVKIYFNETPR